MSGGALDPFYPVLPGAAWAARIASQGAKFIQLRVKDMPPLAVKTEIARALEFASAHGCQLVVNDYWREAIDLGAGFVHLGQGDLAGADIAAIKAAGIRIGISTHSLSELDIALGVEPDYIALGPIYETKLKTMPWAPQGLARIARMAGEDRLPAGRHRRHHARACARCACRRCVIGGGCHRHRHERRSRAAHEAMDCRDRPLAELIHRLSTILTPLTEGRLIWNIVGHAFGRRGLDGFGLQS